MNEPSKLFLLDGMALVYRAYFAFSKAPIMTSYGFNTSAIVGFVQTLWEIIQKEEPTHIVVVFDTKHKTFRHQLFEDYKAHRPIQPEGITLALPYIKAILEGLGVVCIEKVGYEADDVLATLAKKAFTMGFTSYIVSTDKDLAQVVQEQIYLCKPAAYGKPAMIWGKSEILKQWGIVRTDQVVDLLALAGDPSDFIPGIPSIGLKTAQKLIEQFDHLENLLKNVDQIPGKLQATIKRYAHQAVLSKQLATIHTKVPITLDFTTCASSKPHWEKLEPIWHELECKALAKRLFDDWTKKTKQPTLW